MPSNPTFRVSIPFSAQENVPPPPLPTTVTFALPGSAAEDQLRQASAPARKPAYNVMKSRLSTWNLNTPNAGEKYNQPATSFVSGFLTTSQMPSNAMALDREIEWEGDIASNAVDRDGWMATEPPGPFPLVPATPVPLESRLSSPFSSPQVLEEAPLSLETQVAEALIRMKYSMDSYPGEEVGDNLASPSQSPMALDLLEPLFSHFI